MAAQPATKTNTLIEQMNSLWLTKSWNAAASDAFAAEAHAIRLNDVAEGDMLLGIIHGYNGEVEKMIRCFNNSLAYQKNNFSVIFNYGNSLYNNAMYSEAIQILEPISKESENAAYITGMCYMALGLKNKAKQILIATNYTDMPDNDYNFKDSKKI